MLPGGTPCFSRAEESDWAAVQKAAEAAEASVFIIFLHLLCRLNKINHLLHIIFFWKPVGIFSILLLFRNSTKHQPTELTQKLHALNAVRPRCIQGETGCGKSTRVPVYVMEDVWGTGGVVGSFFFLKKTIFILTQLCR